MAPNFRTSRHIQSKMKKITVFVAAVFVAFGLSAQVTTQALSEQEKNLWHLRDMEKDGIPGVSAIRAYEEILNNKQGKPVVVAIIDSGTETFHEDLQDVIWTNEDEIPNNGKDDDNNGYVDDVHGWSFIGGKGGDVEADNLEFTRIYRDLHRKYASVTPANITSKEGKAEYKRYEEMKAQMESRVSEASTNALQYAMIGMMYTNADKMLKRFFKAETLTVDMLANIPAGVDSLQESAELMNYAFENGFYNRIYTIADDAKAMTNQLETQLNIEFDPRHLVGDDYQNVNERLYGNNHIDGPAADHGTHVGGCVGATWNGKGAAGVCNNARLMIIRCVPDGDERDKDVANSIRYAVDNGARIINMSFGKSFSPQKSAVDEAIRYAESKGVLMIHAAGNDFKNTDKEANFPTDRYDAGGVCSTWMEIGASSSNVEMLSADFSNYGKKNVDVFSPGVDIYNSVPGQKYEAMSGTSMASPVAAGVAATLMSYYPNLTAADVKKIMMESAIPYKKHSFMVEMDGKMKKMKFKDMSRTGAIINLYKACQMAESFKK